MADGNVHEILLVEDNPAHARFTREAFSTLETSQHLRVVETGEQALAYLRGEGAYVNVGRPDLIIVDLRLIGMGGDELVNVIKSDPKLRDIPTIVFSSSLNPRDVNRCYGHCANAYVVKPTDLDDYIDAIRAIDSFWLNTAILPSHLR